MVAIPSEDAGLLEHPALRGALEAVEAERVGWATEARKVAQLRQSLASKRQAADDRGPGDQIWGVNDNRTRKQGLYDLYLQNTVLGALVDAIANRVISGTWSIAPLKDVAGQTGTSYRGDPGDRLLLAEFFANCNPDEDFNQLLGGLITDYLIFGEFYLEVVPKLGLPYELYSCNAIQMDYVPDGYGGVKYYTYARVDQATRPKKIKPDWIIRGWNPSRDNNQRAFSLIEGMVNPLYSDQMMTKTQQKTFENMGPASKWIHALPEDTSVEEARAYRTWVEEEESGVLNAGRDMIVYGGATVTPSNLKGIDADFLEGRREARYEAMSRAGVPPSIISYIESGNIGGGTGESQERNFVQNVVQPKVNRVADILTKRLISQMFRVSGWVLSIEVKDMIGDPYQEKVETQAEKRAARGLKARPDQPGDDMTILEIENRFAQEKFDGDAEPDGDEGPAPGAAPTPAATGKPATVTGKPAKGGTATGQPQGATVKNPAATKTGKATESVLPRRADPRPGHAAVARVQAAYDQLASSDEELWSAVGEGGEA